MTDTDFNVLYGRDPVHGRLTSETANTGLASTVRYMVQQRTPGLLEIDFAFGEVNTGKGTASVHLGLNAQGELVISPYRVSWCGEEHGYVHNSLSQIVLLPIPCPKGIDDENDDS